MEAPLRTSETTDSPTRKHAAAMRGGLGAPLPAGAAMLAAARYAACFLLGPKGGGGMHKDKR